MFLGRVDKICLSWDETLEWCNLLNLKIVSVLYHGIYDEEIIKGLYHMCKNNGDQMEGYVIRNINSFEYSEFKNNVVKFVRPYHVQTDKHWMSQKVIQNEIDI